MRTDVFFTSLVLSILPISELRGAIPYALALGAPLLTTYVVCVLANILVGPLVFLFLSTFHRLLYRWSFYGRLFDRFVARTRIKIHRQVERFGYLGLMFFVAVPLPITGAYTGALGAWILGMDRRKALLAIALGVILAGLIVSLVSLLGIRALDIFIRRFD